MSRTESDVAPRTFDITPIKYGDLLVFRVGEIGCTYRITLLTWGGDGTFRIDSVLEAKAK